MKYIILNILQFFKFLFRDLISLVFLFKLYEFSEFYSKNAKTGFIVIGHPCYGTYGDVFYKKKWDAFFGVNKYERNKNGYSGYFKR